jgi:hypothetical protein
MGAQLFAIIVVYSRACAQMQKSYMYVGTNDKQGSIYANFMCGFELTPAKWPQVD